MKKIPVFLIVVISCIWFYTSWYWYTCTIKGFCRLESLPVESPMVDDSFSLNPVASGSIDGSGPSGEKISISEYVQSGSINDTSGVEEKEVELALQECGDLLIGPIGLGNENNSQEVKDLEIFLNQTQGESLDENGVYEQADFEAVKRFQLKYREEILDPWGIDIPTGYVFRTTVKKINEVYCNK